MTKLITDDHQLYHLVRTLPLDAHSLAWVAGAHEGEQVRMLLDAYGCSVWAFEPQVQAFTRMQSTIRDARVKMFNIGLGESTERREMCQMGTLGATYILDGTPSQTTQMTDAVEVMRWKDTPESIDLFLMNMEGYEFVLLPYLMNTGLISRFTRLLVQFHLASRASWIYPLLLKRLENTHREVWEYRDRLWTLWERV